MNAKAPQQSCSYTTLRSLNVGCRAGFLGHVGARDHVMSSFSGRGLAPKALTISGDAATETTRHLQARLQHFQSMLQPLVGANKRPVATAVRMHCMNPDADPVSSAQA